MNLRDIYWMTDENVYSQDSFRFVHHCMPRKCQEIFHSSPISTVYLRTWFQIRPLFTGKWIAVWITFPDFGCYHIGDHRRIRRACAFAQSHQSLRCMHVWRMSLRRMKNTIISWDGSNPISGEMFSFMSISFIATVPSQAFLSKTGCLAWVGYHDDPNFSDRLFLGNSIDPDPNCTDTRGARWLSGRVSDSGARGPGFEIYRRRVVSLSKTLYSPKVLVNYPGSDGSVPTWLKNCWLGR